jgi:hypothetical protein
MGERHLGLVKLSENHTVKRLLPQFPFSYLTFKSHGYDEHNSQVFEVKDILPHGMQIELKNGDQSISPSDIISGELHWKGAQLNVSGIVKWIDGQKLGVAFRTDRNFLEEIGHFLSLKNIVERLKPVHMADIGLEIPSNLKYWLRADGPVEVFVWPNGQNYSEFLILLFDQVINWKEDDGIRTGQIVTKRNLDTPLFSENEFIFNLDEENDEIKIEKAHDFMKLIPEDYLEADVLQLIKCKLR